MDTGRSANVSNQLNDNSLDSQGKNNITKRDMNPITDDMTTIVVPTNSLKSSLLLLS